MKARFKKIALAGGIVLALIQFIQPARNQSGQALDTDISKTLAVPETVQAVLSRACYDCHSNNTRYPWYTYVQPGGWIMAYHVRNGQQQLNFSAFGALSKRRQGSKLESIGKQIETGAMPLPSYLLLHANAVLSPSEKDLLIHWANASRDSLAINH